MRIQDRNALESLTTKTARTNDTPAAERGQAARPGMVDSGGGDRVELSSTLGRLSQAIAAAATQRESRVQMLSTEYQQGNFRPDPIATGRGLISDALAAE